ncbi:MAG: IS66 family insertion sequence element accessory protein TnpB [Steroidobacteraceae bacterium]
MRIWLAAGVTDLRKGFDGLSALVQTALGLNPYSGQIFVFRGRRGDRIKILWDTQDGLCLFYKRLRGGKFVWPKAESGTVSLSAAQLSMLLEGIDWERRETDDGQRVEVPHDEGVANRVDPESCGGAREGTIEALTGAHVGRAIERRKTSQPEC